MNKQKVQPTDITLGNWFEINGFPMYVDAIFRDTVYLEFEGNEGDVWEENIKDLVPVPLTDDILIKLGFVKEDTGEKENHPDYHYWYEKEFPIIGELRQNDKREYLFDMDTDTIRIYYLHELQNLYKILSKEELNISLNK